MHANFESFDALVCLFIHYLNPYTYTTLRPFCACIFFFSHVLLVQHERRQWRIRKTKVKGVRLDANLHSAQIKPLNVFIGKTTKWKARMQLEWNATRQNKYYMQIFDIKLKEYDNIPIRYAIHSSHTMWRIQSRIYWRQINPIKRRKNTYLETIVWPID